MKEGIRQKWCVAISLIIYIEDNTSFGWINRSDEGYHILSYIIGIFQFHPIFLFRKKLK